MIGMRVLGAYVGHCSLQRLRLAGTGLETFVKGNHEVGGTAIVYIPEAEHERLCARLEEAAYQPHQLVARADNIESSGATAQHHQFGREPKLVKIVQA